MITIQLTNARNGIIKKVIDTQYNGVDQSAELTTVYEFNEENKLEYFLKLVDFLEDISSDLGLDFGNDHDPIQFGFDVDWGTKYTPTKEEVNDKIKDLRTTLKDLKDYKKLLESDGNNI